MSVAFQRGAAVVAVAAIVIGPGIAQAASDPTYPYAKATGLNGVSGDFKGQASQTMLSPKSPGTNEQQPAPHDNDETSPDSSKDQRLAAYTSHMAQGSEDAYGSRGYYPAGHKGHLYDVVAKRSQDLSVHSRVEGDFRIESTEPEAAGGDKPWSVFLADVKNTADCNSGKDTVGKTTAGSAYVKQSDGSIKKVALPEGTKSATYKNVLTGPNPQTQVGGKYEGTYDDSQSDVTIRRVTTDDLQNFKSLGSDAIGGWRVSVADYGVDASGKRSDKIADHTIVLGDVLCTVPKDFKPRAVPKKEKVPTKIPAGDGSATAPDATSQDAGPLVVAGSMVGLASASFVWRRRSAGRS